VGRKIPLSQIENRPPEAGRIRLGEKRNGKMTRLDTWRFTSPERAQIEAVAEVYGGTVRQWNEPKANPPNQWDVVTDTDRLHVWLPPGSLTSSYEKWSQGGGCERRCDGENCTVYYKTGPERMPCVCATEEGDAQCKTTSRLSVMVPEIPFSGVYRLDTKSEYFHREAPGMIHMIEAMQAANRIVKVDLLITHRSRKTAQGTRHFPVPQIVLGQSPEQILVGHAGIGQLSEGARPLALGSGFVEAEPQVMDPVWHGTDVDDEVIDGEIVDAEVVEDTGPDGWDDRSEIPPDVRVVRNFGSGKKWLRAE
jgi:hypothetical protein